MREFIVAAILMVLVQLPFAGFGQKKECRELPNNSNYKNALSEFSGKAHLWVGKSLKDKLACLKKHDAVCYVIFDEQWQRNKAIYKAVVDQGTVMDVREITEGEPPKSVEVRDFVAYCKQPALMSYKRKVYLNIAESEIVPSSCSNGPLGFLLLGSIYGLRADMNISLPSETLKAKVALAGNDSVLISGLQLSDVLDEHKILSALCEGEQDKLNGRWRKEHDKLVKSLPRRPPVVYGDVKKIVRKMDGTFIIPHEPPETTRTITWKETVYAQGTGTGYTDDGQSVHVNLDIPIGERECHRTKKITSLYNYDDLKRQLEGYVRLVDKIEKDKPPKVDATEARVKLKQIRKISLSVE